MALFDSGGSRRVLGFEGNLFGNRLRREVVCDGGLDVRGKLERQDGPGFQIDGFAGSRIARGARLAFLAGKRSESADFDGVPLGEGFPDQIEELFDDDPDLALDDAGRAGDVLDQILFCCVCHGSNIRTFARKIYFCRIPKDFSG